MTSCDLLGVSIFAFFAVGYFAFFKFPKVLKALKIERNDLELSPILIPLGFAALAAIAIQYSVPKIIIVAECDKPKTVACLVK